jgi:predicted DNA-binding transcriptional regulator YafY
VIEGYRISKIIGKSESEILQVEEPVKAGGSEWLEMILKAIVEKHALQMKYHGFGKEEKTYSLSPYLLKEYRNRWYVVGFSVLSHLLHALT